MINIITITTNIVLQNNLSGLQDSFKYFDNDLLLTIITTHVTYIRI